VYKYFLKQTFFKKTYNVFKVHVELGVLYWIHNLFKVHVEWEVLYWIHNDRN